jgi:hypothetical protein
LNECFFV